MLKAKSRAKWLGLVMVAACLLCAFEVLAKRPTVTLKDGHIAPLMARVFFPNRTTRLYMITGTAGAGSYNFKARGTGDTHVLLWLDTIATITDTTDEDALFTFKDGTQRRLAWDSQHLEAIAPEDGTESINLKRVKAVQFLRVPRRDRDGYAMFDHWKYSPYTGEPLPEG